MTQQEEAERDREAAQSIEIADRRRRLARLVLTCDPAMMTALEGVLELRIHCLRSVPKFREPVHVGQTVKPPRK